MYFRANLFHVVKDDIPKSDVISYLRGLNQFFSEIFLHIFLNFSVGFYTLFFFFAPEDFRNCRQPLLLRNLKYSIMEYYPVSKTPNFKLKDYQGTC